MTSTEFDEIGRIIEAKIEAVFRKLLNPDVLKTPRVVPEFETDHMRAKRIALDAREKSKQRRAVRQAGQSQGV